jgi:uncharacterized lipoprotein YmbA
MEGNNMMKTGLLYIAAVLTLAMVTALGGCMGKSQPTHFYTLTPVLEGMPTTATAGPARNAAVGIGPVKLADYLNQPRIVTRSSGNRVVQAEFDQWSGSLKDNLTNVLAENISYLLATDRVFIYPWRTYMPVDYQVTVDIIRFDGQPGKEVFLVAHWSVMSADEKKLFTTKRSYISEAAGSEGYEDLVAAQSKVMGSLSREIAEAIQAAAQSTN